MSRLSAPASILGFVLACASGEASDARCYSLTLQKVLHGNRDVVLMVDVEGGSIRQNALKIPDQPGTDNRVTSHQLRVSTNRLVGPVQIQTVFSTEDLALDVDLEKGGTYSLTYGLRRLKGTVQIELPEGPARTRWGLVLDDALRPGTPLVLLFDIDRAGKVMKALPAQAPAYNRSEHPVDAVKLAFDGTNLTGEIGVVITPDAWVPADKQPVPATITLAVSLDGKGRAGQYTAVFGAEKFRQGNVVTQPCSLRELREIAAPIVSPQTPWRAYLVHVDPAKGCTSPMPPADWMKSEFDDSYWARFQDDLGDFMTAEALGKTYLHIRTCFGIAHPSEATDLKLSLPYAAGATAYVNGRPVCDTNNTAMSANIPACVLVKGRNVLAIELRGAKPATGTEVPKGSGRIREIALTSETGKGCVPYPEAIKGTHVWSASSVEQVTETLSARPLIGRNWFWCMMWGRGMPVKGIQQGNPFDPVLPVRITMPRNGVGSGQTVLSNPDGLRGVKASMGPLKGPAGEVIPGSAVQIRYAVQHQRVHYCDALMESPPENARTVPVWLIVQSPKDQAPGWYVSILNMEANGEKFAMPVQVLVTGFVLPDAKDFSSVVGLSESPDTLAKTYYVDLWSDEHFKILERSFALLGQVGNDVIHVPIITSGVGGSGKTGFNFSWRPLIRWVRTGQELKPDFTALEKYLDSYTRYCAPPRGLSLYIWGSSSAKELSDAYENRRIPSRENTAYSPARVQVWDPKTGVSTNEQAPAFGDPGSELFWKPLFEGVRGIVVKRGWSERIVMFGLGGDIRPGKKTCELLKGWAPYARWDFLSHFSGDPGPKDGKMIATGDIEIGMREYPAGWILTASQLEEKIRNPDDFLDLPTARWCHQEFSPPYLFRTLTATWGHIGRMGLDFWQAGKGGPQSTSFFSHVNSLTVAAVVPTQEGRRLFGARQETWNRNGRQNMAIRSFGGRLGARSR